MTEKIEVLLFGLPAGWQYEVLAHFFLHLINRDGLLIVKGEVHSEEGLAASLRGRRLSQRLVKVHCHYLIHVALFVQYLQSLDQVPYRA